MLLDCVTPSTCSERRGLSPPGNPGPRVPPCSEGSFSGSQIHARVFFLLPADPLEEIADSSPQTAANSAAELLKQGAGQSLASCPPVLVPAWKGGFLGSAGFLPAGCMKELPFGGPPGRAQQRVPTDRVKPPGAGNTPHCGQDERPREKTRSWVLSGEKAGSHLWGPSPRQL